MHTTVPAGLTRKQAELFAKLDPDRLPQHIAVIMDGNGRWARRRHLPRIAGHKQGVKAVRDVITLGSNINLRAMTLYAFSAENWKRPKTETSFLMALLRTYLKKEVSLMNDHNIQLRYIGRIHELPPAVQERMAWATEQTSKNTGMIMTLALNYGARAELIDAFRAIVQAAANNGGLADLKIDEEMISRHMYAADLPDPDLVIRTSGEMRLSNFLLWQLAYTEIYVTPTLWPDFDGVHLLEALADFQKRERRYGNVGAAV
ncbi:MAG: isoprenyl transferase [Terracidiphilus sp.]